MTTDLATVATDPAVLDRYADPGAYIVLACERAKAWLASALDSASIEEIVELKSQAEAIRVYTSQKNLGHDAELSAQEIVRRAERGIGVAIRRGQEAGEIAKPGDIGGLPTAGGKGGSVPGLVRGKDLERPNSFVPQHALNDIYPISDVPDHEFESAIEQARAEDNLSRANVIRKIKPDRPPPPPKSNGRPAALHKTRRLDSNRIVGQTVAAASHLDAMLSEIVYADLDRNNLEEWINSLSESINGLRSLKRNLERELSR